MVFGTIITLETVPWLAFAAVAGMTLQSWLQARKASKVINRDTSEWPYMSALNMTVIMLVMLLVVVVFEKYLY